METGVPRAPEDSTHTSSTAGLVQKGTQPPLHTVCPNSPELECSEIATCLLGSLCSGICCLLENGVTNLKLWSPRVRRQPAWCLKGFRSAELRANSLYAASRAK